MKPVFVKILESVQNEVFFVRITDRPYFSTEFHFHRECQMNYIVESEGKRIIGDSIESFTNDELTFLGSDIPHVWHNDKEYFEKDKPAHQAKSVSLFLDPDKLLELLSHLGPVNKLESFLKTARRGVKFSGQTKELLKQMLFEMAEQEGLTRVITLFKTLELLSRTTEYELLASNGYINTYQTKDNDRMDKVFKHVLSNFTTEIQLEKVAALSNMNKQAFCRYFKSRTQKTFIQFVNEIRIGHACKLIADGESHIAALAYNCGYNSLSNFNRFFKEIKGVSPRAYLRMLTV